MEIISVQIFSIMLALLCAVASVSGETAASDQDGAIVIDVPSAEKLLARLKSGHPRLMLDEGRIADIKQLTKSDPVAGKYYEHLLEYGQEILGEKPSAFKKPGEYRLLSVSRRVLKRIYTLGLLYHLKGNEEYVDRAWAELEAAANFPNWNPKHFLDTGEMTHAFAIGYDWLYHQWSDEQREVLRAAMVKHGLTPGLKSYRGEEAYGWFVTRKNNWNQVCNAGLTAGAIALADEEPAIAGEILHSGMKSIQVSIGEFAPDGACPEGAGYWSYAMRYTSLYLASLTSALGSDFGFSKVPGLSRAGHFPVYMTSPVGKTFNFADSSAGPVNAPHLFYLATLYDQPVYRHYQRQYDQGHAKSLLWYGKHVQSPSKAAWPLDAIFKGDLQVATFRSSWDDPDATFTGIRAGDNYLSHGHLDIGSFIIDALGERWVVDLGKESYSLPDYWNSEKLRWQYYRLRAEGHNTLIIDNEHFPDQKHIDTHNPITRFSGDNASPFAVCDMSDAYYQAAGSVVRGVKLINRKDVLVQDEINLDKQDELYWFAHTPADVEISTDGQTATMQQNGKTMRVRLLSPGNAKFTVMAAKPLATSPNPKGQDANKGIRKLTVYLPEAKDLTIAVLFEPIESKGEVRGVEVMPLGKW